MFTLGAKKIQQNTLHYALLMEYCFDDFLQ